MDLLSPWFLAGGLLAGLPLWLHLMRRDNPQRLTFSSLMFFQKRTDTTVRERRLRYLLLLALRLALLLFLVLSFTKPIWRRPPALLSGSLPALHLVCLDTSLSMGYGDHWTRAVAEAEGVLDSLGDDDRAQILANGPSVRVLTAATADSVALRAALAGLEPSHARNSYGDVIEAARNLVANETGEITLHLITDLQSSAMPARFQDLVLPQGANLEVHDVRRGESENWALAAVAGASRVYGEDRPEIEATVASYAETDAVRTVTLEVDGRAVDSHRLEIPAGERASATFALRDMPRGFSRAVFRIEPGDELPVDDERRVVLDNTEPELVLFVSADIRRRDQLYYAAALESGAEDRYRIESSSPADTGRLDPGRYALVILSDVAVLNRGFAVRLRTWVEAGGALLIALGPNSALAREVDLTGHAVDQALTSESANTPFQVAGDSDDSHPVARAAEGLRPVKFFLHVRLRPEEDDLVPVRLGNGDPLLVEHAMGKGRVLLFASALDNVWNDLPLTTVYVPFVAETVRYLSGSEAGSSSSVLGQALELARRRSADGGLQVTDPAGDRVLSLSDAISREALQLDQLGFYGVQTDRGNELVAVNPDPRESVLRALEEDRLSLWQSTGATEATRAESAGLPPPEAPPWRLWKVALLLLVASTLLESVLGNRHLDAVRGD